MFNLCKDVNRDLCGVTVPEQRSELKVDTFAGFLPVITGT